MNDDTEFLRLDVAIVERGLARSRTAARAAIVEGRVAVDGRTRLKPAHPVTRDARIELDDPDRYVSRAAGKLVAALDASGLDVSGLLALDLGASTGGFTQVLLERGARQVVALDVGHGQLAPVLRSDPRVLVIEGQNARELSAERFATVTGLAEVAGVVVADLSFISLPIVLPAVVATVGTEVPMVMLIKPQFEVGRQGIREGIVHDASARDDAIMGVLWAASDLGLAASDLLSSPIIGVGGNHEFLVVFRPSVGRHPTEWRKRATELAATPFRSSTHRTQEVPS